MTKWQEFPLRPQGESWPGLNTRGGKLDPGIGFLEDGSFNAIVNEGDQLQKRKGFIRGLDERFDGVVCGLFRYTDECGIEYLVVADQEGIKVRQPFDVPQILGSDSIPTDDFEDLDTTKWRNTDVYETFIGALRLNDLDDLGSSDYVPEGQLMEWFKPSVLSSYYTEIQYRLDPASDRNLVSTVIKRIGSTYLEATVYTDATNYQMVLHYVQNSVRTELGSVPLGGATLSEGFLRINYDAGTFTASARVIPAGGAIATISAPLTELQDIALGQFSAIGIRRTALTVLPQIDSVSGGRT